MATLRTLILDAWGWLNHKRDVGGDTLSQPQEVRGWWGRHARRLAAYREYELYYLNSGRETLRGLTAAEVRERREYGDAHLLVMTTRQALLGEDQQICVEDADKFDPSGDDTDTDDPSGDDNTDFQAAWDLQEWLREWWQSERGRLKLLEAEENAIKLGDAVYSLGWSSERRRPRLRVWRPGTYFPVLADGNQDDYPDTVRIAWEEAAADNRDRIVLHVITWELRDLPDGQTRMYPWNDETSTQACFMSEAIYPPEGRGTIDALDPANAVYLDDEDGQPLRNVDIGLDFIPVVHVPNTTAVLDHFGTSSLGPVLQILDDIAAVDTDLQKAATTAALPVLAISGASMGTTDLSYEAGMVLEVGEGRAEFLSTERALVALQSYKDDQLRRLAENSRLPESVLGRIKPSEVPSGIALALSFGPLRGMVDEMRAVREEKYPILLRFAQRIAVAAGDSEVPTEFLPAGVEFGSYMLEDRTAVVQDVTSAFTAGVVSRQTAVRMLLAAGVPSDDVNAELDRIESRDFTGAAALLDATADEQEVRDYLHIEGPPPTPDLPALPPVPPGAEIPPQPGQPPQNTPQNGQQPPNNGQAPPSGRQPARIR